MSLGKLNQHDSVFQMRHVVNQVEFATELTCTQVLFLLKDLQGFTDGAMKTQNEGH